VSGRARGVGVRESVRVRERRWGAREALEREEG